MERDQRKESAREPVEKMPERIGYFPVDARNSLDPAQEDQRHQRGKRDFADIFPQSVMLVTGPSSFSI